LAWPSTGFPQSRQSTVFAPATNGSVTIRAAIVLADYTVKALPLQSSTDIAGDTIEDDGVAEASILGGRPAGLRPPGVA
jgi:hypothetical protein